MITEEALHKENTKRIFQDYTFFKIMQQALETSRLSQDRFSQEQNKAILALQHALIHYISLFEGGLDEDYNNLPLMTGYPEDKKKPIIDDFIAIHMIENDPGKQKIYQKGATLVENELEHLRKNGAFEQLELDKLARTRMDILRQYQRLQTLGVEPAVLFNPTGATFAMHNKDLLRNMFDSQLKARMADVNFNSDRIAPADIAPLTNPDIVNVTAPDTTMDLDALAKALKNNATIKAQKIKIHKNTNNELDLLRPKRFKPRGRALGKEEKVATVSQKEGALRITSAHNKPSSQDIQAIAAVILETQDPHPKIHHGRSEDILALTRILASNGSTPELSGEARQRLEQSGLLDEFNQLIGGSPDLNEELEVSITPPKDRPN